MPSPFGLQARSIPRKPAGLPKARAPKPFYGIFAPLRTKGFTLLKP